MRRVAEWMVRHRITFICFFMLSIFFIAMPDIASVNARTVSRGGYGNYGNYGRYTVHREYGRYNDVISRGNSSREHARRNSSGGSVHSANKSRALRESQDIRRGATSPAVLRDGGLTGDRTAAGDEVLARARLGGQYKLERSDEPYTAQEKEDELAGQYTEAGFFF